MRASSEPLVRSAIPAPAPPVQVAEQGGVRFALSAYQAETLRYWDRPDALRAALVRVVRVVRVEGMAGVAGVEGVAAAQLAQLATRVLARHAALRLQLSVGSSVQWFASELPRAVEVVALEPDALRSWTTARAREPLDLAHAGYDCAAIALPQNQAALYLAAHELILDAPSFGCLLDEIVSGLDASASEPAGEASLHAWMQRAGQVPIASPLQLTLEPLRPFGRSPDVSEHGSATRERSFASLELPETEALPVLTTALLGYLHRITGNRALALRLDPPARAAGAPLGPLSADRVLRFEVEEDDTFASLLARVTGTLALEPSLSASRGGLLELLAADVRWYAPSFEAKAGMRVVVERLPPCEDAPCQPLSPLSWQLTPASAGLHSSLQASARFFPADGVSALHAQLERFLRACLREQARPLAHLPLLDAQEEAALLAPLARTTRAYPAGEGFVALFAQQVQARPDAIAARFEEHALTYAQLDARSNQLARVLQARRALSRHPTEARDVLIGLCLDRSLEMLVALVAALKAGFAYVPLDPSHPADRIALILQGAEPALVLTTTALEARLAGSPSPRLLLDVEHAVIAREQAAPLHQPIDPEQLAYVIFTSGSTGKPKGVQIPHRALSNFLRSMAREPGMHASDSVLALTTVSFDIHVLELLLPLTVGAQLEIASKALSIDAEQLKARLSRGDLTVLQATPATYRLLLEAGWAGSPQLTALIGGEALTPALAKPLRQKVGALWNMYGPTETTVWSSLWRVERDGPISIGEPIDNTRLYVLDPAQHLLPQGVAGELWIGGDGLARGYHGRDDLTAERFVPDPYASEPGARMYRTGDLARLCPDGTFECLGRVDHQVKVRGYRIELGEIEAVLAELPEVSAAAVIVREDRPGDPQLVAYYTNDCGPRFYALRDHARAKLPPYMVPAHFEHMAALPLTPNGKVDRKALPAPHQRGAASRVSFLSLHDDMEQVIARVFAEVTGCRTVGAGDNFFQVGGTSLLAVRAQQLLQERLGLDVPLGALFEQPTVRGLARAIADGTGGNGPTTVALRSQGTRAPVFCVLGVHLYQALADQLADLDRPWYGVYLPDDERLFVEQGAGRLPQLDVEALAGAYIEAILRKRPTGPYCLVGFSFGGVIAYEIAQRLTRAGEHVEQLVLLDSVLERGVRKSAWGRLKAGMRASLSASLKPLRARVSSGVHAIDLRPQIYDAAQARYEASGIAPFPGRAVFVHALQRTQVIGAVDERGGFGDLVEQGVTPLYVPGDHHDLLGKEVAVLANALRPHLAS